MLIAGPTAQHAPQRRENATEPGRAAEYAVQKSDRSIPGAPRTFQVWHFRSQQIVKAERDQQQADLVLKCTADANSRTTMPAGIPTAVCTENLIRVDDVMESPKLAK